MPSDAPADRRLAVTVDLVESLGSEVVVHFTLDAPPPTLDDARELATDVGVEALESVERGAQGGHLERRRPAQPAHRRRVKESLELVVDTARLHFFDADDGLGIYGTEAAR